MNKNYYIVVGLGVTGISVVKYLIAKNYKVAVTDTRSHPPELNQLQQLFPFITVYLGELYIPDQATHIILSPGVSQQHPVLIAAIAKGQVILGDIELYAHASKLPVIAVTGSNGKSTVVSLLAEMAKASGLSVGLGGNIGTPALSLLEQNNDIDVLELSSFQLETTNSLIPTAATILNITADHMDRYVNLKTYQQAKQRIYQNAINIVINRDDPATFPIEKPIIDKFKYKNVISFGLNQPPTITDFGIISYNNAPWCAKGDQLLIPVADIAMLGKQNVMNALAALALGDQANFSIDSMLYTLRTFPGLPHRCEVVANINNIIWINDSKGTNAAATIAAIDGLSTYIKGKWIIILGGISKNADFSLLFNYVKQHCKLAILIGSSKNIFLQSLGNLLPCVIANDMVEVVAIASKYATMNDGVLLSPACASFDMFNNYMHRGDVFKQEVKKYIAYAKKGCQTG